MKLQFRPADPSELPQIRQFLLKVFGASPDAPFAREAHLHWKYFQSRSGSETSTSFVLESGGSLAAHACAWPFAILTPNGESVQGIHPIDWVSSTDVPGAGALLLRELRRLESVSCCIGGTEIARKVIAQTGYKETGLMRYYSRPLRPWKQFLTHPRRNYKLPARLVRNAVWSIKAGVATPAGWTATLIEPGDFPSELQPQSSSSLLVCHRSAALFRYFFGCPIARYQLYTAARHGQLAGYFLLSATPGQVHVADAWVMEQSTENWESLYRLAVSVASAGQFGAEITAAAAIPAAQQALQASGFKVHATVPIMLFDPKKLLPPGVPIHFQMIDNDLSFLHAGVPNYAT